jgi:hypothetical protein
MMFCKEGTLFLPEQMNRFWDAAAANTRTRLYRSDEWLSEEDSKRGTQNGKSSAASHLVPTIVSPVMLILMLMFLPIVV